MRHRTISTLVSHPNILRERCSRHFRTGISSQAEALVQDLLPPEWYKVAYARLIKLSHVLKNVEQINGRLTHTYDGSIIAGDHIASQMQTFNSLVKPFIASPIRYHSYWNNMERTRSVSGACFSKPTDWNTVTLNSLTKICNLLNISAQQRSSVRLTVCPQATQHHIWRGALEEVLRDLKYEMDSVKCKSRTFRMAEQIASTCIQFFAETASVSVSDSPSWMRPTPMKKVEKPQLSRKWEEVLEMFVDLSKCISKEEGLAYHVSKIESMKEGLYQIRDILIEKNISYKEAQRQDCLVQKKLSKSLGHSSKCLFTLLLYYLYGTVRDIEVEVCGALHGSGRNFSLCIGKVLPSDDERMVRNGVKQLGRALGIFKFVWETAAVGAALELHGHLWCLGAEEKTLTYRGNVYYVHGIRL
ncbi:uncharacterized protein [Typha angustifolia]|uniref:uncharacterized protein n=1 Tax=Typha angustifolia TaxID=59011 RepID=UPI003C2E57B8